MVQRQIVTYVCDECGTEQDVEERQGSLDGKASRSVDACPTCWERASQPLRDLLAKGRSPKVAARRLAG